MEPAAPIGSIRCSPRTGTPKQICLRGDGGTPIQQAVILSQPFAGEGPSTLARLNSSFTRNTPNPISQQGKLPALSILKGPQSHNSKPPMVSQRAARPGVTLHHPRPSISTVCLQFSPHLSASDGQFVQQQGDYFLFNLEEGVKNNRLQLIILIQQARKQIKPWMKIFEV